MTSFLDVHDNPEPVRELKQLFVCRRAGVIAGVHDNPEPVRELKLRGFWYIAYQCKVVHDNPEPVRELKQDYGDDYD